MLAPVAVSTGYQGKGIGQSLISFGLNELKNRSTSFVTTYGDPSFYSKVGFQPLSEDIIQAPLKLTHPIGWLGYSLTNQSIPSINERPRCVKEFNNPIFW
jgi:predicted N-acetyltransferase YhbS